MTRIPGLDGLRAVSLLLVLQTHLEPSEAFANLAKWERGGLMIFFVL
jgi:peptidoglycan/LPS O-acetylase OafA/YrhL